MCAEESTSASWSRLARAASGAILPVLLTLQMGGCESPPDHARKTVAESPVDAVWRLEFQVSGGFAGESDSLKFQSRSDSVEYVGAAGESRSRLNLERGDVESVARLIAALPAYDHVARNEQCRDCFEYSLSVWRGDRVTQVQVDSTTLPGSPVEELITTLLSVRSKIK